MKEPSTVLLKALDPVRGYATATVVLVHKVVHDMSFDIGILNRGMIEVAWKVGTCPTISFISNLTMVCDRMKKIFFSPLVMRLYRFRYSL